MLMGHLMSMGMFIMLKRSRKPRLTGGAYLQRVVCKLDTLL